MSHAWIFEVLRDIRSYVVLNNLKSLVPHLDAAYLAAVQEMGPGNNVLDASEVLVCKSAFAEPPDSSTS